MENRDMSKGPHRLVVVGHGAAGLTAAVAAAEAAHSHDLVVEITLLEKAAQEAAGGNTLWSPSYMRLDASDRIAPDFEDAMSAACDGRGDRPYFRTLAQNATLTVAWLTSHGVTFCTPIYYLSAGPRRIAPAGGGRAIVVALSRAATGLGVELRYGCCAERLVTAGNGRIGAVVASDADGPRSIPADAVVLASGGFQADAEMMRAHFGPGAENFKLISPGTRYNSGDGIRMAIEQGARTSGDWNGMHAEPIDPRSENSAPVVLVYPYGIVIDQNGRRFFDEGGGLVHETWERFARQIHFETPGGRAYAILDSRLFDIAGYERAIRSEVAPHRAATLEGLAGLIGVEAAPLIETVTTYNRAATGDPTLFDPARRDGLAASAWLDPPKSNWARAIAQPPFLAYPLVGAIAYTFGGLATNERAEVLGAHGPLPGLYAAGEITGHFWGTAPNAVSVLRALVFGRIAGREAISFFEKW
jgi:tricarballylate dehydrogenase